MLYLEDTLNFVELTHHALFFWFLSHRIDKIDQPLFPPSRAVDFNCKILVSLVSLTSFAKILTFFRAHSQLAKLVILLTKVFEDLLPFTLIYIMIILQQAVTFTLSNVRLFKQQKDFPGQTNMSLFSMQLFSSFINSIGDINRPEFEDESV